ncbi:MAG: tol-pal system protein YbgF [Pseudomonadota bacterium]
MIRRLVAALVIGAVLATPVLAQDRAQTLADIRAELGQLAAQVQSLRSELVAGGAQAMQAAGGSSALERMDAMEAELAALTRRTEDLQNRVNRIVQDGTNRISDLEFRLCEMEKGCDTANMPITAQLGGDALPAASGTAPAPATGGSAAPATAAPELAVSEKADFDRAKAALDGGDFRGAADLFAAFTQTYPGSPLGAEAMFLRGEAYDKAGETSKAARAYLEAFSGAPDGPFASRSLLRLGAGLGKLGQTQEACVTLTEVGVRFPQAPETAEAATAMRGLGCP